MKKILVLLLLISAVAFLYLNQQTEEKPSNNILTNFKTEDLSQISIISGGQTIKLNKLGKSDQSWEIIEPVVSLASKEFITNFNSLLSELSAESVITESEVDKRQGIYGLIPPERILILEGNFGKEILSFGKHVDFASARYLQKEKDAKIYLVKEDLFALISLDLNAIRNNHPVEFDSEDALSIAVIPTEQPAYVVKKKSPSWILESVRGSFDVDLKLFNAALEKLAKMQVIEFIDSEGQLELFGLDRPILTLRVLLGGQGNSRVLDLIFGRGIGKQPSYYLREVGKPTIYRIFRGAMSDWIQDVDFFRSKQLFAIPPNMVNGAKIEATTQSALSQIVALSSLNTLAFKALEPKIILLFTVGDQQLNLELGDKLPGEDAKDSPSFVKINSENQEYVLILSAKDTEILTGLNSSN